jgi:hypothetical protein
VEAQDFAGDHAKDYRRKRPTRSCEADRVGLTFQFQNGVIFGGQGVAMTAARAEQAGQEPSGRIMA